MKKSDPQSKNRKPILAKFVKPGTPNATSAKFVKPGTPNATSAKFIKARKSKS